jgi:hypothetical protein
MPDKISLSAPDTNEFDSNLDWSISKLYRTTKAVSSRTITFSNDVDGGRITLIITNSHTAACIITWPSYVSGALTNLPSKATVELTFTKIGNSVYCTQDILYYETNYIAGTYTITPPANVTKLKVICTPSGGGGGGGGGFSGNILNGGGGGGGGGSKPSQIAIFTLSNLNNISMTVGAGGAGGAAGSAGVAGSNGSSGSTTTIIQNGITLLSLIGGAGGGGGGLFSGGAGGSDGGENGQNSVPGTPVAFPGIGGNGGSDLQMYNLVNVIYNRGGHGGNGGVINIAATSGQPGSSAEVRLIFY